jgi:hypothetical protein
MVPVTVAVPLLQFVFAPPLVEGKRSENPICPVIDPFCSRRNPPLRGLAAKDVPVVVKVNCQFPATCGPLCGGARLLPPPQLEVEKATITSTKRQRPVNAGADILCVLHHFCSFMCFRAEFMSSQSSVL